MQDQRITRECAHCKASFLVKASQAARGRGKYCGMACFRPTRVTDQMCSIENCTRPVRCRDLCAPHYGRTITGIFSDQPIRIRGGSVIERFLQKVTQGDTPRSCWLWHAGSHGRSGYGSFRWRGKPTMAHRVAYELFVGPIPDGLTLDHLCRIRPCVNPKHLEPVPFAVNVARGISPTAINARKTHCPQGHPYDAVNTLPKKNGGRDCRACRKKRWQPDA